MEDRKGLIIWCITIISEVGTRNWVLRLTLEKSVPVNILREIAK